MQSRGRPPHGREIEAIAVDLMKWLRRRKVTVTIEAVNAWIEDRLPTMVRRIKRQIASGDIRSNAPRKAEPFDGDDQDDAFFYIAGYTSGGAPYGLPWHDALDFLMESEDLSDDSDLPFEL